jgi:hypothetical protein
MIDLTSTETTNLDRYGHEELPWSRALRLLSDSPHGIEVPFFLGTADAVGTPYAAGIGAVWCDDDVYFTSNPRMRKARNLAVRPACTISVRLPGLDVVLEGEACRTTDRDTLERLAGLYREGGWPAEVEGDAIGAPFSAPSAGPGPWHLYRFTFHTVTGVAAEPPHGATRWRFGS